MKKLAALLLLAGFIDGTLLAQPVGLPNRGQFGDRHYKYPVANAAALSALTDHSPGDVRLTLDTFTQWVWNGSAWVSLGGGGGGSGTVTSVALTLPPWLAVAGSPIAVSGTFAVTSATGQTSHQVIGTCGSSTAFGPCSLVAADIPTLNQSTTGNALTASDGLTSAAGTAPLTLTLASKGLTGSVAITPANPGGAVALQASTPGTAQTGNLNLSGAAIFGGALSASNLSGTNTGDQTITGTGDVTGSGTGSIAWTIATGSVTLAKMASMATASFLGRNTAGTGAPEVLSEATAKTMLGLSGTNSGDQVVPVNTTATGSNYFTAYNSTTGAFTKARPACADLSDSVASCSTDTTSASNITSGTLSGSRVQNPLNQNTTGTASNVTGIVATANGGFGANNSGATGVPVFASGTATVTTATGSGAPVQATSPTLTTPLFSGAIGSDFDLGTHADLYEIANEGSTGTTVNKLAKLTGAPSTAVILTTSDLTAISGIAVAGAGTTGNAQLARAGRASCVFDGATTAGDYVQASATVAGDCHDAGATLPTANQILGRVLSTNGAGGTYAMTVYSPGINGGGGGISGPGSSSNNSIPTFNGTGGAALKDPGTADLQPGILAMPDRTNIKLVVRSDLPTFLISSDGTIGFDAATHISSNNGDTYLTRSAAGVLKANNWIQSGGECFVASDQANATTTMASSACTISNLVSGRKYAFICELFLSDSTSVDGAKIDFNGGTATSTNFRAQVTAFDTALNLSSQITSLSATATATTFSGAGAFEVHGAFEPSGNGTFIPEFSQNSHTTGTLTLARGSHCKMWDSP